MMNAGKYYIGDLCYVMHGEWVEFCEITLNGHNVLDGEFKLADGRCFATYNTKYGDGTYEASNGAQLSVDAGLIGCIKVEDIDQDNDRNHIEYGTIVEFDAPFSTYEENGIIHFGNISVDTDPSYEEEEDNWEYEEDEY